MKKQNYRAIITTFLSAAVCIAIAVLFYLYFKNGSGAALFGAHISTFAAASLYIAHTFIKSRQNQYLLKVDKSGKIVRKSRAFDRQFSVNNIFHYIYEKENLSVKLRGGNLTLMLVDNNSQVKYLSCKSVFDGKNYKMVCHEVTDIFNEMLNSKKYLNCDMVTGLQHDVQFVNDFETAASEHYFENFGVAVIEIVNLNRLKTMYGRDTVYKLQKHISDTLLYFYEGRIKVYYSIEEKYILFADTTSKAEIMFNGLKENLSELEKAVTINGYSVKISIKAGVQRVKDLSSYSGALRDANTALKYAKQYKNKNFTVYDESIMKSAAAMFETKESVLKLINSSALSIYYQPQYSMTKKRIVGFEALTRLTSPELMSISVQEFFEAAEKNGAMIEVGAAICEKTLEFVRKLDNPNIAISLNISPVQLLQDSFIETFLTKYRNLGLKKGSVCIEITETFLMQSYDGILEKLNALKKSGIAIYLDDFGTAYSSMMYLNKLPLSGIKIDKAFINGITENGYNKAITEFMIKLSDKLKLSCIAEGVEDAESADMIYELGGDIIQGYYISKAVDESQALAMIEEYVVKDNGI